jgi:chromosome segregation ATPase
MFKSSTKELSGKIDWIMQILNEINVKINDNSSRIMKLEAELRGIHLDEIGENIKAINEGLYKVKEAMNEAGKMREIISAFKNLNVKGEFKENTDELKKSIEEVMQQLLQIKSEVYSNIKALTDKINSIQTIHQEIMKNIMSVKDLEVNALKNISTITIMQKEIGETEENIRKLLEHYKEIIDKTASTKIELNKLMNEIERI